MKEIYRKTSTFSFVGGVLAMIFCIYFVLFVYEGFSINGNVLFQSGIMALTLVGSGIYFRNAYNKLTDTDAGGSILDLDNLKELNIQRVPSFLPKIYSVDFKGNPILKIEVSKGRWLSWLTFFEIFQKGLLFPVYYTIADMNGNTIATFKIKNNVKQYVLSLMNPDGTLICNYIQQLSKSTFKNFGVLYHEDGSVWRVLQAENAAGDIDVKDEDGKITASYRFGLFPHAMNPAFQSTAHHEHVRFGLGISSEEKLAYTVIFFFWLRG